MPGACGRVSDVLFGIEVVLRTYHGSKTISREPALGLQGYCFVLNLYYVCTMAGTG